MARAAKTAQSAESSGDTTPEPEITYKRYVNVDYKPHTTAAGGTIESGMEFNLPEVDVAPEDQRLIDNGSFVLVDLSTSDDGTTTEGDAE